MTTFGGFPRTTVLDGPKDTSWSAQNSLSYGIKIYAGLNNGIGIWAQEYYEWWNSLLWLFLSTIGWIIAAVLTSLHVPHGYMAILPSIIALTYFLKIRDSSREIYSHAITVVVGRMFNVDYELRAVNSLQGYSGLKKLDFNELLDRMEEQYPAAQRWADRHFDLLLSVRSKI